MGKFIIKTLAFWLIVNIGVVLLYIHFPSGFEEKTCTFVGGILFSIFTMIPALGVGMIGE